MQVRFYSFRFQSMLPARGATDFLRSHHAEPKDFNPRSPHGERLTFYEAITQNRKISIHAPRTGSDYTLITLGRVLEISIHAPRTGSDDHVPLIKRLTSTISIHAPRTGSDTTSFFPTSETIWISIHAPRTGSDAKVVGGHAERFGISIHAPRTGSDRSDGCGGGGFKFQSTLPARGATRNRRCRRQVRRFQSTLPARGATALYNSRGR